MRMIAGLELQVVDVELSALADVFRVFSCSGQHVEDHQVRSASLLKSQASTPIDAWLVCPTDVAIDSVNVPSQLL